MKVDLEYDEKSIAKGIARALKSARECGGLSAFLIEKPQDILDVLDFIRDLSNGILDTCSGVRDGGGVCTVRVGLDRISLESLTATSAPIQILAVAEVLYAYACYDHEWSEDVDYDWACWKPGAGKTSFEELQSRVCHSMDPSDVIAARIYLVKRSLNVAHTLGGTPYGSQ